MHKQQVPNPMSPVRRGMSRGTVVEPERDGSRDRPGTQGGNVTGQSDAPSRGRGQRRFSVLIIDKTVLGFQIGQFLPPDG